MPKANNSDSYAGLLSINFNQDISFFSIGTDAGFRIFSLKPFKESIRREYQSPQPSTKLENQSTELNAGCIPASNPEKTSVEPPSQRDESTLLLQGDRGGFGIVEMLYKTNIIALVGGGLMPKFPKNRLILYDDQQKVVVCEIEVKSEIQSIRIRKERIVIVTMGRIIVFTMSAQPQKIYSFETNENERGIVALSTSTNSGVATLAFPGRTSGQIHVVELPLGQLIMNSTTNKIQTPSASIINAHSNNLAALAISEDGSLIASASVIGTLIRIFDSKSGKKMYELRRGATEAEIYSMHFNKTNTRLAVASDKGTIHVFNLIAIVPTTENMEDSISSEEGLVVVEPHRAQGQDPISASGNRQSALSFLSPILPKYFSSEWSFAYAHLPVETKCICGFVEDIESSDKEKVVVVGRDGSFYSFSFNSETGGEMNMDHFYWFIKDKI